jgi:hypothetical protein
MNKLILTALKPRNPLVRAARFRQAGAHGKHSGAMRQFAARDLRREIDRLKPPSP